MASAIAAARSTVPGRSTMWTGDTAKCIAVARIKAAPKISGGAATTPAVSRRRASAGALRTEACCHWMSLFAPISLDFASRFRPNHSQDLMRLDIYVNYRGTCEEAFRFYERLLGGEILKMEKTFFANRFAMVRDRFGTSWMLLQGSTAR
jgi:hypothetical protein